MRPYLSLLDLAPKERQSLAQATSSAVGDDLVEHEILQLGGIDQHFLQTPKGQGERQRGDPVLFQPDPQLIRLLQHLQLGIRAQMKEAEQVQLLLELILEL